MRWTAVSLLAINILVLIAQLTVFAGEPARAAPEPSSNRHVAEGESLHLLREVGDQPKLGIAPRDRRTSVPESPAQTLCTLVGPFDAILRAEYLVERLAALDVQASIEELEIPGDLGYWVYLPPRESRRQAFNELRELQAKGIDSYVIPRGELANGISFGMFSQAALAQSRLEDMQSRGYAAEIKETPRIYRETWVVVSPNEAQYLDVAMWQGVLQDDPDIERRQNFCPPVASRQNFH